MNMVTELMQHQPPTAISLALDTDELASHYEIGSESQFKTGLQLIDKLAIVPGQHVLDVGTGTGRLAFHVATLVGAEGSVTGIDPLQRRIDIARRKVQSDNVHFSVGDAQDLSRFAPASFDVVYLNGVIHWLSDPLGALEQCAWVLKPGGRLGISTASGAHPYPHAEIKQRVLSEESYRDYAASEQGMANHPTPSYLENLLHIAGFDCSLVLEPNTIITDDVESMIQFVDSSSFGNFVSCLPSSIQPAVRDAIKLQYEQFRTEEGIRVETTRLFAVATKS